ncbi:MAG: hypothetical protein RIC06_00035 [Cyclobacteriaceae bacterium]
MKNNTIDSKLLLARVAMENTLGNKPILDALSVFGYNSKKIKEGMALLEDAEQKHAQQKKEYGEQFSATDDMTSAMEKLNDTYMGQVMVSRIALKDKRGHYQTLQIQGRRKKTYSGWLKQAAIFYTNALNDKEILAELSKFGMTPVVLEKGLVAIKEIEKKIAQQKRETGEAQEATAVRDEAFEKIEDWVGDFLGVARVALRGQPQMIESLGVVEP